MLLWSGHYKEGGIGIGTALRKFHLHQSFSKTTISIKIVTFRFEEADRKQLHICLCKTRESPNIVQPCQSQIYGFFAQILKVKSTVCHFLPLLLFGNILQKLHYGFYTCSSDVEKIYLEKNSHNTSEILLI